LSFILQRSSPGGGLRFQCERCGKIINNTRGAVLLWDEHGKGETASFTPRIACSKCGSLEERHPMSKELDTALIDELKRMFLSSNDSYLNDINAGDVMRDKVGDLWKVVGQHGDQIVCLDEPIDDCFELPLISLWPWEQFSQGTLVRTAPPILPNDSAGCQSACHA
jgi:hypothetical protein